MTRHGWCRHLVFGLCFASAPALAEDLDARGALDGIAAAESVLPTEGATNPDNRVFAIPQGGAWGELRPNLRLEKGRFQLLVRPRFRLAASSARVGHEWQEAQADAVADWVELYGAWNVSDQLALAYGLMNFQWGPAESLGPSNGLFHQPGFSRNLVTLTKGKRLVRVNWSPRKNLSAVLLAETQANDEEPFVAGEAFEPRGLVKLEAITEDGAHYLGVTIGKGARSRAWIGEYASALLTDGLSVYVDARHERGSRAWIPVEAPGAPPAFRQDQIESDRIYTLGVAGVRYTFEGGEDLRLEYVHNDAGYDSDELRLANDAVRAGLGGDQTVLAATIGQYLSPGLELPGRRYLYASVYLPELGKKDRLNIGLRALTSLVDRSSAVFGNIEWIGSDSWLVFLSGAYFVGEADGDLTRLARATVLLAEKTSW